MKLLRHNPGFFDDDDDEGGEGEDPLFGRSLEPSPDEMIRLLEGRVAEQGQREKRVEAAQSRGGVSPRALGLAEAGLRGALSDAQKVYAELGAALDKPTLGRQERRDMRDARRLLEDAWGVNALRLEARPSKQKRFKTPEILAKSVRMPLDGLLDSARGELSADFEPFDVREPTVTLQAVASFGRKYVPMGRGRMGQRPELKGVYYGLDAQDQADRDYAQMLLEEGARYQARLAELTRLGALASADERRRVEERLNEVNRQKKKLVERRLATAEKLKELLK